MKKLLLPALAFCLVLSHNHVFAAGTPCITLICAPDKTVECGTNWVFDPPTYTDPCCSSPPTITILSTNATPYGKCTTVWEQVWLAQDCAGLSDICTQTVTVVDTTPPMVTCAPDKTVVCGSSWVFDTPTAIDACCGTNVTIVVINTSTNANPAGCGVVASQVWDIRDCCTNSIQCYQHVTILPGPPVLLCTNGTVPCGGSLPAPPTPPAYSSPCCTAVNVFMVGSSTNPGCGGSISYVWKAVDCCGNSTTCTQLFNFVPSPPTLLCSNQVVECDQPFPTNPPPVFDMCCSNIVPALLSSTTNFYASSCGPSVTQVWTATNCCGGGSTICTQIVTVVDTTPPVLTCASNKTVQCGSGWVFNPPTALDACCGTNVTYSFTTNIYSSPLVCQTVFEGIWRVADCCTNFSVCTQLVTQVDTLPPVVTCASNKTVQCNTTWVFDPPISAFDLCCGTNLTYQILAPVLISSTPCQKVWGGPWQVGDCCGNYTICTQVVTEVDTAAPSIICSNKVVQCGFPWTFDPPAASDCCGTNLTYQLLSSNLVFSSVCQTIWAGVWQVTDCCSNSSVCTQRVAIVDTLPPVFTFCPNNMTVAQGTPWNFGVPTANDFCCGTNVTITVLGTFTNNLCCGQTITRKWVATDCCTNTSAPCTQVVTVTGGPPPPNDACANAIVVSAGSPAYCGTTACATPTSGLPPVCGLSANSPDVWFKYTPICSGPVTVDTCGLCTNQTTLFDTVLSAYSGTCNSLTMLACNDDAGFSGCLYQSFISFNGTAGVSYYIRVAGYNGGCGTFRLNITGSTSPPPNDLCANAIVVQLGSPAACGTTVCATPSTGIPIPCGNSVNSPDVWYTWTPLCNGVATIDTCGWCTNQTNFNTVLSIYSGACSNLWPVACNNNAGGPCGVQSRVIFTPVVGVTYYIRVAGIDTTNVGPFRLNIAQNLVPPFNDACSNAITLLPSGVSMFSTCGATLDGPNNGPGCPFSDDVWFRYKAPCSGLVTVDTCGTPFNTVAAVYTGNCGSLNFIACNDNATNGPCNGSQQSFLTFTATSGTIYTIRVGGTGGAQGWGIIKVIGPFPASPTCPPTTGPCFWRLFQVQGLANNSAWSWSIRSPCCANITVTNVPGLPVNSTANQLAQAFCNSINATCPGAIQAFPITFFWQGLFAVCVKSCTNTPQPWIFSIGPAGTPAVNQCVVANLFTPCCPLIPLPTSGPCSFNPPLIELPYANADLNNNGIDDALDIMSGTSADLNMNGIPDEVEACQGPELASEPVSQAVALNSDITLAVSATGTEPLGYQWSFNGSPLDGQTTSALSLNNIAADQLGDYAVTVSNTCGTTIGGPYTLSMVAPEGPVSPVITAMQYLNGSFQLTFATKEGQQYAVDFKNNLDDPTWTELTTWLGDGEDHTVVDTPPLPKSRFYRLRLVIP